MRLKETKTPKQFMEGILELFKSGRLAIYAGPRPATADDPITPENEELISFPLDGAMLTHCSDESASIRISTKSSVAIADGAASFARFYGPYGAATADISVGWYWPRKVDGELMLEMRDITRGTPGSISTVHITHSVG